MTEKEEVTTIPKPLTDDGSTEEGGVIDEEELGRALEAVLFAAGYPVPVDKLCKAFSRDKRDMKRFISSHTLRFNSKGLGIMMLNFEDKVQLCTREEYKDYIREVLGLKLSGKLSASSMEVLAIIAYSQPATKAFVDKVRGVDCGYAISSLVDKELIYPCDRLEVPGRPLLYATTDNFLRVFGISTLEELPGVNFKADPEGDLPEDPEGEQLELTI